MNIKISFGMIVLNGEPFIKYNLRALYPYAHEIIVVEGAAFSAASVATKQGHSKDRSITAIKEFIEQEDPVGKVIFITAEDHGYMNGFWPGEKDEQSQAYAQRATGDYLWQIDSDEFYQPDDFDYIITLFEKDPTITAVSFPMITFWGDPYTITDGWFLKTFGDVHRIFKWGPGYKYISHRPPTVVDERGRDLRTIKWINGKQLRKQRIYMYHYSLLFPRQVYEKCSYYQNADWAKRTEAVNWYQEVFLKLKQPFRVHNVYSAPSWLEKSRLPVPPIINEMWNDVCSGKVSEEIRRMEDVQEQLRSRRYQITRLWLKVYGKIQHTYKKWKISYKNTIRLIKKVIKRTLFYG